MVNCPHCGAEDSIEVCVDAYVVYTFKGFDSLGYPVDETYEAEALRTDEFEDVRVVCAQCGEDINHNDIGKEPVPYRGKCYDCGERALFCLPDMYGPKHTLDKANLVCGIHAANHVAFDGETKLVPLFWDEDDYGGHIGNEPPEEWVRVQEAFPLINEKEDN